MWAKLSPSIRLGKFDPDNEASSDLVYWESLAPWEKRRVCALRVRSFRYFILLSEILSVSDYAPYPRWKTMYVGRWVGEKIVATMPSRNGVAFVPKGFSACMGGVYFFLPCARLFTIFVTSWFLM